MPDRILTAPARRCARLALATAALAAATACSDGTLDAEVVLSRWCGDSACGLPTTVVRRNDRELWVFDQPSAKRVGGEWKKSNPCGPFGEVKLLGFQGSTVWARCSGSTRLVRSDDGNSPVEVQFVDGSLPGFLPLAEDVLFVDSSSAVYGWDGNAFTLVAPAPPITGGSRDYSLRRGVSRTSFYMNGFYWNGSAWQPLPTKDPQTGASINVTNYEISRPVGSKLCAGPWLLDGLNITYAPFAAGWKSPLDGIGSTTFLATYDCSTVFVLAQDNGVADIYRLQPGKGPEKVGGLPEPLFVPGPEPLKVALPALAVESDVLLFVGFDDYYEVSLDD